ncbi:MAG: TadE/TadG family type IV pilus assembly protein [Rhizobiaceae bacterium]
MLNKILKTLKLGRFVKNESGSINFLAMAMVPLLALSVGVAIDTAEVYRAKINFQNAVDAGTLMAAKTLARTGKPAVAQQAGKDVFQANIKNLSASTGTIDFDMGDGNCVSQGVTADAKLRHPIFFEPLHKLISADANGTNDPGYVHLNGASTVKCGNNTFEIALVLDNSGSMRYNGKIAALRIAAEDLVTTLHASVSNNGRPDPMQFSIVPFAATVNVGANNSNADWMDKNGVSPIHHDKVFNWELDPNAVKVGGIWKTLSGQKLTRFTVYNNLPGQSWGGCVEARPNPYHTNDDEPTEATPATMIVPSFAPDTPDDWDGLYDKKEVVAGNHETCILWQSKYYYNRWGRRRTRSRRYCRNWTDGYWGRVHSQDYSYRPKFDDRQEYRNGNYIGPASGGGVTWVNDRRINEETYQNNYLRDDHNFPSSLGHPRKKAFTGTGEDQHGRQKWTWKYMRNQTTGQWPTVTNVNNNAGIRNTGIEGPNSACTSQAISDLTAVESATVTSIRNMTPNGATNIQQGLVWGWRTLSPGKPFTNGRDYDALENKKIMIVMSDGNNTYYPTNFFANGFSSRNKSYYGAYGLSNYGRVFEGYGVIANPSHSFTTFTQAIDYHLINTCTKARNAGIKIYTIAFDVPNGSTVKTMLQDCASLDYFTKKPLYFDAANNAELIKTFKDIAEKLAELRITN